MPPTHDRGNLFSNTELFRKRLPSKSSIFTVLLLLSVVMGIASVGLVNNAQFESNTNQIIVDGLLTGMVAITLPTVLTAIFIKVLRWRAEIKHILFVALMGEALYSIFLVIASATTILRPLYGMAGVIILVGDASIVAWWLFVNKVMFGHRKGGVLTALVQPTLNVLTYIPASNFLFIVSSSIKLLFIKLYVGIFIFIMMTYAILYIFDRPMQRSMGFPAIDAFSKMFQSLLFDTNIASPFGPKFGSTVEIDCGTLVMKGSNGGIKSVFFLPVIHYGPAGAIGGSNFPYILERRINDKYRANGFIMHATVNEDFNPVSSWQIAQLYSALDSSISRATKLDGSAKYFESTFNNATVKKLEIGKLAIVTFTRAPRITEDVSPEAALIFTQLFKNTNSYVMLIDAHNSRMEMADKKELDGVAFNSKYMNDYIEAIKRLGKPLKRSHSGLVFGSGSVEAYYELGSPEDIAHGNINVAVFDINRSKFGMIQFNSNNMLPSLRTRIVEHVREKYNINAEVYTTDTHEVNSLSRNASNVLGRHTGYTKLIGLVDRAIDAALTDMGPVDAFYANTKIKNFQVWGRNVRERMLQVANSVIAIAKILVPITIVGGFIIAAWIISVI
jgi:predicted neutral ceramidase superfamily lipid hydrolase